MGIEKKTNWERIWKIEPLKFLSVIPFLRIVMFDMEENSWSGGHHAQLTEVFRPYRHYNLKLLYVWKGAVPGPEKRKSDILSLLSMGKG